MPVRVLAKARELYLAGEAVDLLQLAGAAWELSRDRVDPGDAAALGQVMRIAALASRD